MTDIVAMLRDRANCARNEKNGTAEIDAIHFDSAADEIERLRAQVADLTHIAGCVAVGKELADIKREIKDGTGA